MRKWNKKGVEVWIAWVLAISLAVALSVVVSQWMVDLTGSKVGDIERIVEDESSCNLVTISADSVCQDTQTLYMNISNTNNLRVDAVYFRLYNVYDEPSTVEINTTLRPAQKEEVELVKQGTLKKIELIPVTIQENTRIVCRERLIAVTSLQEC